VASNQGAFLWPSKLGLAHMKHLVLAFSSNSCIDNGFGDHLGAM